MVEILLIELKLNFQFKNFGSAGGIRTLACSSESAMT